MPWKAVPATADQFTSSSVSMVLIVSLLIRLSIGGENCAWSLCAYVEGFCKSDHICVLEKPGHPNIVGVMSLTLMMSQQGHQLFNN